MQLHWAQVWSYGQWGHVALWTRGCPGLVMAHYSKLQQATWSRTPLSPSSGLPPYSIFKKGSKKSGQAVEG